MPKPDRGQNRGNGEDNKERKTRVREKPSELSHGVGVNGLEPQQCGQAAFHQDRAKACPDLMGGLSLVDFKVSHEHRDRATNTREA